MEKDPRKVIKRIKPERSQSLNFKFTMKNGELKDTLHTTPRRIANSSNSSLKIKPLNIEKLSKRILRVKRSQNFTSDRKSSVNVDNNVLINKRNSNNTICPVDVDNQSENQLEKMKISYLIHPC